MTTAKKRARRANQSLSNERGIKSLRTIYWTKRELEKLLLRLIKKDRQEWFAARVNELKNWPLRTREQIAEDASRINPRRLMDGKWAWPKGELEIQRDLLRSAPENSIDLDALRAMLAKMDNRQGDRLIEFIAESGFLQDTTVPLDNGLPQPKEIGTARLRRIKRLHKLLLHDVANDPDGDLAAARRLEVPRANLRSSAGWDLDMAAPASRKVPWRMSDSE